jgi:hypothetical protein
METRTSKPQLASLAGEELGTSKVVEASHSSKVAEGIDISA